MTHEELAQLEHAYLLAQNRLHELTPGEFQILPSIYADWARENLAKLRERAEALHEKPSVL